MQAALIIALKAFLFSYRLQYVFLSGICLLPVTGGFCDQVKSIYDKEKPFL